MDPESKVIFREEAEEKGIKAEGATKDATIRFNFLTSTTATSPQGRGTEARTGDGEEHQQVELKKLSLQPEKYDRKGDFEGWVNQFEEYAMLSWLHRSNMDQPPWEDILLETR